MKYWLLTSEYPPFYGGGISTYCASTAKMFAQNGHSVTVFTNDSSVAGIKEEWTGTLTIVRFNPAITDAQLYLGHTTNLSYAFAEIIRQYIGLKGRPDVIEAQDYLGIAYYLLQYKYLLYDWCQGIPIIVTAHSPAFLYLLYNHVPSFQYPDYWIGEMERFCFQAADWVISPSVYLVQKINEHFSWNNKNISVIPNPYESPVKQRSPADNKGQGKIIFYGKMSAQKGTFKLLEYFKELWLNGFEEELLVFGGQDIVYHPEGMTMGAVVRKRYQSFITAGKLRIFSKVSPDAIGTVLSDAKVVIVPSTIDNLPYVALEMMAMGNVVLVSKQGGQAEVVEDGIDGFVFDHETEGDFKLKLLNILKLSEDQRAAIQNRARQTILNRYSFQAVYDQKIRLLNDIAERTEEPGRFPFIRSIAMNTRGVSEGERGKLSIVVPFYNMGLYLPETISSLRKSNYNLKEVIIVNDGTDERMSSKVLDGFRNQEGITIIDIPNAGLANARNIGAAAAKGEFLAFLDADDTIAADYHEKAIEILERYPNVFFVGCWTQYFGKSDQVWPTFTPEPPIVLYHNTINTSALVYKRSAFLARGQNDCHMPFQGLEDYESLISLIENGFNGVVIPEIKFNYQVRNNSMIRSVSGNKKLYLAEYITRKHKAIYANFAPEVLGLMQANGPGFLLDNPSLDRNLFFSNPYLRKIIKHSTRFIQRYPVLKNAALKLYRKFKS